ncbi:hypothetical protein VTJ04DRAFT_5382 [Mycothermus thermophilus]|uniref:uncharacterized protein n=1 Tax=Humicola insolens TaxID=85995 RepID=UPI003742D595
MQPLALKQGAVAHHLPHQLMLISWISSGARYLGHITKFQTVEKGAPTTIISPFPLKKPGRNTEIPKLVLPRQVSAGVPVPGVSDGQPEQGLNPGEDARQSRLFGTRLADGAKRAA